MAFNQRLKELREAAGLTQAQLAERAGLHRMGVAKLEQGQREPAWPTLQALASAEVVIRQWIETAHELGRAVPEPRGRLMYA